LKSPVPPFPNRIPWTAARCPRWRRARNIFRLTWSLACGGFLPPPTCGAETTPRVLGLAEAQRIALERNWDLLAAKANVDQAVAQKIVAREFPNPTLALSTSKINTDGRVSSTATGNRFWDRNYDTIAAVNQLFEIGKRSVRQASAAAGAEAAEASFRDAQRTLDLAVSKAYIAALFAQASVRILHQSAESLQHEAKIAETRLHAGDISKSDKAQIEIAAERLELDAEGAQSNAQTTRIAVEILLGEKNPRGEWRPADSLDELALAAAPAGDGEPRPDLVAAEAALRKAGADVRLQRAMRIPDPTLLVQFEHEPPDQPDTVGFGVSLPLPIWNFNTGNIRAAEAVRAQAATQVGKVETQIASEIASAELALGEAGKRWHRYQNEIQPRSAEVLQTVAYAYKKGGAALLDLLAAERTDNDVRLATAQAMADSATAAATLAIARNAPSFAAPAARKTNPKKHAALHF
jgi:cobalt-zinc-cadmium efflux system outer membrane protein